MTLSPDQAITAGISADQTADGWAIGFQRFLVSVGRVTLDGDDCNEYSDTTYTRILDASQGPDQKVNEHFGLGSCGFSFGVFPPPPDAQLGSNVSADDLLFMRTPASNGNAGGVSIYVEGQATRGSEAKHFAWAYRWVADYENCRSTAQSAAEQSAAEQSAASSPGDGALTDAGLAASADAGNTDAPAFGVPAPDTAPTIAFDLVSGAHTTLDLLVAGAALFRDSPSLGAKLRFDPFAAADTLNGNDDGEITLDEIGQVPITALAEVGGYDQAPSGDLRRIIGRISSPPTLEDYLYTVAFPSVVHYDDQGRCDLQLRAGRRIPID